MRLMLERRPEHSRVMVVASPLIAIALTVVASGIVFAARGLDPLHALYGLLHRAGDHAVGRSRS